MIISKRIQQEENEMKYLYMLDNNIIVIITLTLLEVNINVYFPSGQVYTFITDSKDFKTDPSIGICIYDKIMEKLR